MIVGLIAQNKGTIAIMGHDVQKERAKALANVGAVVESPELYGYMTGRQNLRQIAAVRKVSKEEIDRVIDIVGLTGRIDEKVSKYSLGMKQRLGIGAAILAKPKLLILDEPTNGLDPSGILDFREIVRRVARETNAAVFISSHILSEVQELCDRVAFVKDGVIKSVENIKENEINNSFETIAIVTKEKEKCEAVIKNLAYISEYIATKEGFTIKTAVDSTSEIIFALSEQRVPVQEVYLKHKGLEERYMELIEGGVR